MSSQPKTRSRTYIAVAILILVILSSVGYYLSSKPGTPSVPTTTTPAVTYKDTLIVGTTDSVFTTLDPADAYDYFAQEVMIENLGSPLVDIRPGSGAGPNDFIPALATNWTVSSDGLMWTFNLRHDVKFGDGTCCFNASTVKYHFDRGIQLNDPNGPFVGDGIGGVGGIINETTVTNLNQVVFHLNFPFAPFLSLLAFQACYIVNPNYAPMNTIINYTDGNARLSTPMDFGPYVLANWTRVAGKDTEMKLDANPYYWNASGGYPRTPHIIIRFYADDTDLALATNSGDVDVAYRQLSSADIIAMEGNSAVKVWKGPSAFIQYLVFQEKIKPFDDVRVRRAIAAAVDRSAITNTVFRGMNAPLYSMVASGVFGHTEVFKQYGDANYTYTTQELNQLGYSPTNKLVVDLWYESSGHYQSSADIATVLKSSLEGSGVIQVNLHGTEWASFRGEMSAGSMPVYILGGYPDYIDPDNFFYPMVHSVGGSWINDNYASPKMDEIVVAARTTIGPQREQLYLQADEQAAADMPMVPLFQGSAFAVTKPGVGGVILDVTQDFRYYTLYENATAT